MKKRLYIVSMFILLMTFGTTTVSAQTVGVNDEIEFSNALENSNVSVVKLQSDFTITERNMYINSTNSNKTVDLNGYTITYDHYGPQWNFAGTYENFELVFTDTSLEETGKINNIKGGDFVSMWINNVSGKFTFKIAKGKYENLTGIGSMFFIGGSSLGSVGKLDIIVDDAVFSGNYSLFRIQNIDFINNVNMKLGKLTYYRYADYVSGSVGFIGETSEISTIFDTAKYNLYRDGHLVTDTTARIADVTAYTKLEILEKETLIADPITLLNQVYGYSEAYYNLNIVNNSLSDIELVEVKLSNNDNFEIVGTLPSTIYSRTTNNFLQLKVKENAEVGTYSTTITGVDSLGNEYDFGEVSFTVTRMPINPTITMDDWTYEDDPNHYVITNNPSDGNIIHSWYDSNGSNLPEKPTKPGKYEVSVTIGLTNNYDQFNVRVPFEIFKKELSLNSISISDKYYHPSTTELTTDQVTYILTTPGISYVKEIVPNNPFGLFVGSHTASVTIKIDEQFEDYYEFTEGGNLLEYTIDVPYNILKSSVQFILLENNLNNSTNTPVSIRPGTSIDLNTLFDLNVPEYKNRVQFGLLSSYDGVTLNGNMLETDLTATAGVIEIRLYFPALDVNGDLIQEYGQNFEDIYIRVTPKEELIISGLNNNEQFTYDGIAKAPTGVLLVEDNKVDVLDLEVLYVGVGTTDYNSNVPPINAGMYKVTYKISDSNEDYFGSTTYIFEILKANPLYDLPTNLVGTINKELNTIFLPEGFTWKYPNHIMDALGNRNFLVTYTPSNPNYNIIEDIEVTVYVRGFFNVNTNSLGNGTITPSVPSVLEGATVTVEFIPELNYEVDKVLVNGNEVKVSNNELIVLVTEDLNIEVSFRKTTYTVTIKDFDKDGLIVTPDVSTTVEHGDNFELLIEVKEGYNLLSVKVNAIDKKNELVEGLLRLENIDSNNVVEILVEKIKDNPQEEPKEDKPVIEVPTLKEDISFVETPVVTPPSKKEVIIEKDLNNDKEQPKEDVVEETTTEVTQVEFNNDYIIPLVALVLATITTGILYRRKRRVR